jgi:hypothetical protein
MEIPHLGLRLKLGRILDGLAEMVELVKEGKGEFEKWRGPLLELSDILANIAKSLKEVEELPAEKEQELSRLLEELEGRVSQNLTALKEERPELENLEVEIKLLEQLLKKGL